MIEEVGLLPETEGIFAETADGIAIAASRKLVTSGIIRRDELRADFITGAGLKTQEVIANKVHAIAIQRTPESFQEVFGQ